jgi:hypothetical protein
MRKAVAWELAAAPEEVGEDWEEGDLKRALRMVWGSTSGVGWEEERWPAGRDKEGGRPSLFTPPPGESLSLLVGGRGRREGEQRGGQEGKRTVTVCHKGTALSKMLERAFLRHSCFRKYTQA